MKTLFDGITELTKFFMKKQRNRFWNYESGGFLAASCALCAPGQQSSPGHPTELRNSIKNYLK